MISTRYLPPTIGLLPAYGGDGDSGGGCAALGNPLAERPVLLSVSGSGNTVVRPADTDANGRAKGTTATTTPEEKTARAKRTNDTETRSESGLQGRCVPPHLVGRSPGVGRRIFLERWRSWSPALSDRDLQMNRGGTASVVPNLGSRGARPPG